MADELTFEQIQKCKKVFDDHKDKTGVNGVEGKLEKKEITNAMKDLKFEMNENEVMEILNDLEEASDSKCIDFPTFLRFAARKFKENEFATALEEAFKTFSIGNSNELTKQQLQTILTDFGPKLSEEKAAELVYDIMGLEEKMNFYDFIKNNLNLKKDE